MLTLKVLTLLPIHLFNTLQAEHLDALGTECIRVKKGTAAVCAYVVSRII